MRKFYSFETMFFSLANELKSFLNIEGIYAEVSSVGKGYHFEISANADEVELINEWLDENTITAMV